MCFQRKPIVMVSAKSMNKAQILYCHNSLILAKTQNHGIILKHLRHPGISGILRKLVTWLLIQQSTGIFLRHLPA